MKDNSIKSNIIEWLRFFCIVEVVLIHSKFSPLVGNDVITRQYAIYDTIRIMVSEGICRVAVPIFFLISGYLFFIHLEEWRKEVWITKMKKRVKTLLLPYILWNLISMLYSFIMIYPKQILTGGGNSSIDIITWLNNIGGFRAFWDADGGMPNNSPLWFLRDLIVVVLFTPVVYYYLKKTRLFGLILLYLTYFFKVWVDWSGFSVEGFFFFSLGAYFSIYRIDFTSLFKRYWIIALSISVPLLLIMTCTYGINSSIYRYSCRLFTLSGTICTFGIVALLFQNKLIKVHGFLSNSSFFIYAAHGPIVLPMVIFALWKVLPSSEIGLVILYFLTPILTISILLICYYYLSRWMPKTMAILTGGRIA